MRSFFLLVITATVAGLIGYELGRKPDAPNVLEWLARRAEQVDWKTAGGRAIKAVRAGREELAEWTSPQAPVQQAADAPATPRALSPA